MPAYEIVVITQMTGELVDRGKSPTPRALIEISPVRNLPRH
ncbi:hypothetical protein [Rhizobium sp. YTU87027]